MMSKLRKDFDPVSPNRFLNDTIFACADEIPEASARKILQTIKAQHATGDVTLADHTSREILTGRHLVKAGYAVEYSAKMSNGQTPDWPVQTNGVVSAIVECVKHNPSQSATAGIDSALSAGQIYTGYVENTVARLVQKITTKALKYTTLVQTLAVPYVVSVVENFMAPAWMDEVDEAANQVFANHSDLSGLLYINDANGKYYFRYRKNPAAMRPFDLPDEIWTPPRPVQAETTGTP